MDFTARFSRTSAWRNRRQETIPYRKIMSLKRKHFSQFVFNILQQAVQKVNISFWVYASIRFHVGTIHLLLDPMLQRPSIEAQVPLSDLVGGHDLKNELRWTRIHHVTTKALGACLNRKVVSSSFHDVIKVGQCGWLCISASRSFG